MIARSQVSEQETRAYLAQLSRRHQQQATQPARGRSRLENFFANWGGNSNGGFQGGRIDRLTEDWNPGQHGPNRLYQMGVGRMRERARDLVNNNPLAKSAVESWVTNCIRQGIDPKPVQPDAGIRKSWVRAWHRWGGETPSAMGVRECDLEGDSTIAGLQALWLYEVLVGGGCLIHFREVSRRGRFLPLALQLIPEERFAEHLDRYGANPKTANPVFNGVEVDSATNRTLAYHILASAPNDLNYDPEKVIRLPSEQCSYGYLKTRAGQKRGYPILHAVIVWLWALGYYTDNELYNSDIKSNWSYMIKTSAQATEEGGPFDWNLLSGDINQGTVDYHGNTIDRHEPGMVFRGAPGDEISAVGPNVPGSDSLPWINLMQRLISVGADLSYEEVVRDFSKGSFSSVRASRISDQMRFRRMQQFAVDHFCNPTYGRFVMQAARSGIDGFPTPEDLVGAFDEWLEVNWSLPGWASVNPREDALADDIRLKNGTITRRTIVERDYGDIDEHFDQLEDEKQMAEDRKLRFDSADPNGDEAADVPTEGELDRQREAAE